MSESTHILERRDRMGIITLNRPGALNAINTQMNREVTAVLDDLAQDEGIDVIILTGAGEKSFCAGRDLKEMATLEE